MTSNGPEDHQLIRSLEEMGEHIEFPETPEIAEAVVSAIASRRGISVLLPYGLMLIAIVILAISAPQVRSAMVDALNAIGIEIRTGESSREDETLSLLDEALFGVPVTMEEAQEAFGKSLAFPGEVLPGSPDAIYLKTESDGIVSVTFAYGSSESLPEIGETDIGAILTQITGPANHPYLVKSVFEMTTPIFVTEGNLQMQWIEQGELSRADDPDAWRASANVLIWLDGDVGYRLESRLSQEQSVHIAESMAKSESRNQLSFPVVREVSTRRNDEGGFS